MTAVLVSGLSGAGKSTALHALEDIGFFCTDNLPLDLLPAWYATSKPNASHSVAAGIDVRGVPDLALPAFIIEARYRFSDISSIFLEASDAVLMRRFSLLRRRHPFLPDSPLPEAIRAERHTLAVVREQADIVLDTSNMNPWELSEKIEAFACAGSHSDKKTNVLVTLISFSYRHGLPQNADIVFDARFLPNPHYDVKLRQLTGKDVDVAQFLAKHDSVQITLQHMQGYCQHIWPFLQKERKQYLTIAIGCSGGKHRSVYLIEQLAAWMSIEAIVEAHIYHRELDKIDRLRLND